MSKMIDSQNRTGPKPTTTTFGTTLRDLRRSKKLTQTELAALLTRTGIPLDVVYLSHIENGHSEQPPSEALETDPEPLIALTNTTSTG